MLLFGWKQIAAHSQRNIETLMIWSKIIELPLVSKQNSTRRSNIVVESEVVDLWLEALYARGCRKVYKPRRAKTG